MELKVKRLHLKPNYTIGKLFVDGVYFCDTLEDKVVDLDRSGRFEGDETKTPGETAIPYGVYKVEVSMSPRFGRMLPRLLDVPHFEGILIHRGNTAKDTSGCILVGENKQVGAVLNSTPYEIELTKRIAECQERGEDIHIVIE